MPPKGRRAPKPDILARLRADFGDYVVQDDVFDHILGEVGASLCISPLRDT